MVGQPVIDCDGSHAVPAPPSVNAARPVDLPHFPVMKVMVFDAKTLAVHFSTFCGFAMDVCSTPLPYKRTQYPIRYELNPRPSEIFGSASLHCAVRADECLAGPWSKTRPTCGMCYDKYPSGFLPDWATRKPDGDEHVSHPLVWPSLTGRQIVDRASVQPSSIGGFCSADTGE